jgi:large subunit ribosomal protein L28
MKCEFCAKSPVAINRVTHSRSHVSGRTRRWQKPNITKRRMVLNGVAKNVAICTKCLRTQTRYARG